MTNKRGGGKSRLTQRHEATKKKMQHYFLRDLCGSL